jgi:hypothetical protein
MSDNEACLLKSPIRAPWNRGKLIGGSPHCMRVVQATQLVARR